jgi:hypothetical protein
MLTNNSNGVRMRQYADAAKSGSNGMYTSDINATLYSRRVPRGARLAALVSRSAQACGSVRGLLFGPSTREKREIASLRAQLARTPAEEAVFDVDAHVIDRPVKPQNDMRFAPAAFLLAARISGTILGAPRIANCAAIIGSRPGALF